MVLATEVATIFDGVSWLYVGANFSAIALVAWLVKHTFQHTIPRLAATFEKAISKLTDDFKSELTACRNELTQQRQEFREELRDERAVTSELNAAIARNTEAVMSLKEDE